MQMFFSKFKFFFTQSPQSPLQSLKNLGGVLMPLMKNKGHFNPVIFGFFATFKKAFHGLGPAWGFNLEKTLNSQSLKRYVFFINGIILSLLCCPVYAGGGHLIQGQDLSLWWGVPFLGILLSLAFLPLFFPRFWHGHFGKITLGWTVITLGGILFNFGFKVFLHEVLTTYLLHYMPFIILAGSLFVIAGGIRVTFKGQGTPLSNGCLLGLGTLFANLIGTTGAAMVFIRPLLATNNWRSYKVHTLVFFIILVCNVGGSLTVMGDPPLFLGYLFGIDFFWPIKNLYGPFLTVTLPLLLVYVLYDLYIFKKEDLSRQSALPRQKHWIQIRGGKNIVLLLGVIGAILLSGTWRPQKEIAFGTMALPLESLVRDGLIVSLVLFSLYGLEQNARKENKFTWTPLMEVVKLFAGIFMTACPVIILLDAGSEGALGFLIHMVSLPDGTPLNKVYFWLTGFLSSFLDNAPTYMIFFHMASGNPMELMTTLNKTLMAISAGAVFMGALTYIGNAPNFMIKAMAEEYSIKMPSFFGYIFWASCILLPFLFVVSVIYF